MKNMLYIFDFEKMRVTMERTEPAGVDTSTVYLQLYSRYGRLPGNIYEGFQYIFDLYSLRIIPSSAADLE